MNRVAFEIEGFLVFEDEQLYELSREEIGLFAKKHSYEGSFHTIATYGFEGKTRTPHKKPLLAARDALNNVHRGVGALQEFAFQEIRFCASPTGEDITSRLEPLDTMGVHVHIDVCSSREQAVVWYMREELPWLMNKYSSSSRMSKRFRESTKDFSFLSDCLQDKRTINYHPLLGTIECSFPDTTTDLETLAELGEDIQLVTALAHAKARRGLKIPPPHVREDIMREQLREYL